MANLLRFPTLRTPAIATLRLAAIVLVASLTLACAHGTGRASAPGASSVEATPPGGHPRLVVMLVIDQLREPYLERFGPAFTGGLRRLLDQGRFYTRATHDHSATETAVGHASLATGVYPMRHGIVGNEWSERTDKGWASVSNVYDPNESVVGFPALRGASPRRQLAPSIADWVAAADPRAIVASVSGKDRGAIRPAGLARGNVFWFDTLAARFVTSTYYRRDYPEWAETFTRTVMPRFARDSVWESHTPASAFPLVTEDSEPWERDGVHTTFPHRFVDEEKPGRFWQWFLFSPKLDLATLEYAKAMTDGLSLGRDDVTDFLNVSLSATDLIGHTYGPLSREQLDNLLSVDRALGDFFTFLDARVGKGEWVVALSADHGSLLAPETLPQPGESPAGRRATAADYAGLRMAFDSAAHGANDPANAARVARLLKTLPFVANAIPYTELAAAAPTDSFALLSRRSYYPGRAAGFFGRYGVDTRFVEGWLPMERGTSHGTPYWFDRHVPMIFMGPGVVPGRDSTRVATVDFAPTLARMASIRVPEGLDGRVLRVGGR